MKKPLEVLNLYPPHDYTLAGAFASRLQTGPDRELLVHQGKSWTWQAFDRAVQKLAGALTARGIKKGDRVSIVARNSDAHPLLLFACARIGAIMVPSNPEFGVQELGYVFMHAAVSAVICGAEGLAVAREAAAEVAPAPWFSLVDGAEKDAPNFFELIAQAGETAQPVAAGADDAD
jgi:crotonobetaine/carnitine-CoA ligase